MRRSAASGESFATSAPPTANSRSSSVVSFSRSSPAVADIHRASSDSAGIVQPVSGASGSDAKCQTFSWPWRSAWGLAARMSADTSLARSHSRSSERIAKSTAVRSQLWLPSRAPTTTLTTSPRRSWIESKGPIGVAWPALLVPLASTCRVAPRQTCNDQSVPLLQPTCTPSIPPVICTAAETGLRQPTITRCFASGCTATPWGFIVPGMRNCSPDELAITCNGPAPPQPLTVSHPSMRSTFLSRSFANCGSGAPMPRYESHPDSSCESTACFRDRSATVAPKVSAVTGGSIAAASAPAARHSDAVAASRSRCVASVATICCTSRSGRSARPGATSRGFSQTAKS